MTASVRISLKAAKALLELVDGGPGIYGVPHEHAEQDLRSAISRAERASVRRRKLAKPKAAKRATKREETSAVRAAVFARADGQCELCGRIFDPTFGPGELHHALGRGKAHQAESNCLALCHDCHHGITNSRPSAAHWLMEQAECFERLGHHVTVAALRRRLAFVEARADAESKARAAP